jgi:hypothetical protein
VWVASADGEGVFLIQSFDCKYSLCAGTDKAKQEWFNALFTTIEKLFKVRRHPRKNERHNITAQLSLP